MRRKPEPELVTANREILLYFILTMIIERLSFIIFKFHALVFNYPKFINSTVCMSIIYIR